MWPEVATSTFSAQEAPGDSIQFRWISQWKWLIQIVVNPKPWLNQHVLLRETINRPSIEQKQSANSTDSITILKCSELLTSLCRSQPSIHQVQPSGPPKQKPSHEGPGLASDGGLDMEIWFLLFLLLLMMSMLLFYIIIYISYHITS